MYDSDKDGILSCIEDGTLFDPGFASRLEDAQDEIRSLRDGLNKLIKRWEGLTPRKGSGLFSKEQIAALIAARYALSEVVAAQPREIQERATATRIRRLKTESLTTPDFSKTPTRKLAEILSSVLGDGPDFDYVGDVRGKLIELQFRFGESFWVPRKHVEDFLQRSQDFRGPKHQACYRFMVNHGVME